MFDDDTLQGYCYLSLASDLSCQDTFHSNFGNKHRILDLPKWTETEKWVA